MFKIDAKITGASDLKKRLARISEGVGEIIDQRGMAEYMLKRIQRRYLQEKDPEGNRWRDLSPKTKKGPQILMQTGTLFKAIGFVRGRGQGNFAVATGAGFAIGVQSKKVTQKLKGGGARTVNPAEYGRAHQLGLGVPQRKFLGFGEGDTNALRARLRRDIRKLVG